MTGEHDEGQAARTPPQAAGIDGLPNANEAAVARNKASKLMQEHGLSEQEVLDSDSAGRMFEMSMGAEGSRPGGNSCWWPWWRGLMDARPWGSGGGRCAR